jgi:hypothetical protein
LSLTLGDLHTSNPINKRINLVKRYPETKNNNMKKYLILVLLIAFASAAYAQQYQDVVYLKNGSIIRGVIVEQIPNQSIKIESAGNVFVFKMDEIEKITKEEISTPKSRHDGRVEKVKGRREKQEDGQPKTPQTSALKRGYSGIAELAFGIGYGDAVERANELIKINLVNSFRFNPHVALGLSTGARFLMHEDIYLVPIMADLRINVLNRKASPYFVLNLGSAFNGSNSFTDFGTMFGFGVGAAIKVTPKNNLNIGFTYEAIGTSNNDYFMSDVFSGKYRSFGVNVGFTF